MLEIKILKIEERVNQKKPTSKDKKSNDGIEYISFKNEAQGVFKDRRFTQRKS